MEDYPVTSVRRRIGRKLAWTAGGLTAALALCLFGVMLSWEKRAALAFTESHVGLVAESLAIVFNIVDPENGLHSATDSFLQLANEPGVTSISVLRHDGRTTWSTDRDYLGGQRELATRLQDIRLEGDEVVVVRNLPATRECLGCHIGRKDVIGAIRVSFDRSILLQSVHRFHFGVSLASFGLVIFLLVVMLMLIERWVSRPLFALANLVSRAEQGDFLVRARVIGYDEIASLGQALNRMLRAITSMKASELDREADLHRVQRALSYKEQLEEVAERLRCSNQDLERRVMAQELLMEAAHQLSATLNRASLLKRFTDFVPAKLGRQDFALCLWDEESSQILNIAAASGCATVLLDQATRWIVGEGLIGHVAQTGAVEYIKESASSQAYSSPELDLIEGDGSILCVPMLHKGKVIGVLAFFHPEPYGFDDDDVKLLRALGAQAAIAFVNADLYERTVELSITDPLTQMMNRRALQRRLEEELVRAQRFGLPLTLLMIDVDHFKQYNDQMGHLLGDEALCMIARALQDSVRKVDGVARFGGEEFCVFLPRTDEVAGRDVAEKLRQTIRNLEIRGRERQPLGHMSVSIGLAVYPKDLPLIVKDSLGNALVDVADRAVYAAKDRGRDRVVLASENAIES